MKVDISRRTATLLAEALKGLVDRRHNIYNIEDKYGEFLFNGFSIDFDGDWFAITPLPRRYSTENFEERVK